MKAEITLNQLWMNPSVRGFFFRNQSEKTFNNLINSVVESLDEVFNQMEEYTESLDDLEELLYNEDIDELIDLFGLTKS